ncbi:extensin-like [Homarus americanus]|uniref:extensin-like n=1 Tax=Homarus americanus TaxID=6706 RepID=UPI001C464283|nr:extensin-like [Homarus americanus]
MNARVVVLLGVVVVAAADKLPSYTYSAPQDSDEYSVESSEAKYDFSYAVKDDLSGNDFGHQETRDGDNTQGSYYVQLPDGRLQTVTYYVEGDSGYVADVKYDGEARYPDSDEVRSYTPPRPQYSSPESDESYETPVYVPPRPSYNPPRPTYNPPRPTYNPPLPAYNPPRPTYTTPRPSYNPPRPTYTTPRPTYTTPRPTYKPTLPNIQPTPPQHTPPNIQPTPAQHTTHPPIILKPRARGVS